MDSIRNSTDIADYLSSKKIIRREYGTPVENVTYPSEVQQKYDVFFADNAPIHTSKISANIAKKNRRKLRPKTNDKINKYEQGESSKNMMSQGNSSFVNNVSNSMSSLSLQETNLDSHSKIKIVKLTKEKQSSPDNLLTDHDGLGIKKYKKPKTKNKIIKNVINPPKINGAKLDNMDSSSNDISSDSSKIIRVNERGFDNRNINSEKAGRFKTQQYVNSSLINKNNFDDSPKRNKKNNKKDIKNGQFNKDTRKKETISVENLKYNDYMSKEEVDNGLETGELIKGNIRINTKDFKMAYITNPKKAEQDIVMESVFDRNRALDGDLVVIKIKPESEWRGQQKTGIVVYILKKVHPRTAVGTLKLMSDRNKQFALFHPRDSKIPRIKIPFTDWPALFYDNADKYEAVLFLAEIKEWDYTKFAIGSILENIGMAGDIKTETEAILKENCIEVTPYSDEFKKYFPSSGKIPEEEFKYRMDLRKECIFTIDPLTARDLDDAVSCKELPNGNYEIGVHISDVTFFLKEGNILDELVSERATSTYMVESVYHMLPKELCMMCSLLPGEDKLAFSVFWEMTPTGEILSHKFSRTVINSCVQLAYEHAQTMLENPTKVIPAEELPIIYNGFTSQDISKIVNILNNLAIQLRKGRFDSGALRIDQPKLLFSIDPATCEPLSYRIYVNKECHRLIEEFMLLANITVATRIRSDYPDIAFLRSHPPPSEIMTYQLQKFLETVGIHLNISSASGFQKSLSSYLGNDTLSQGRMLVLNALCAKTMSRAIYFCANNREDYAFYWHYALNIPLYTHFTSPIRRYPDIMVHRLLSGSLGYTDQPKWDVESVAEIALNCNLRKFYAKRAGEQSLELYLIHYIKIHQPLIEEAVVLEVKNSSIDVIILKCGVVCKINLNKLPIDVKYQIEEEENLLDRIQFRDMSKEKRVKTLNIYWPVKSSNEAYRQIITIFSLVKVELTKVDNKLQINADLLQPDILPAM